MRWHIISIVVASVLLALTLNGQDEELGTSKRNAVSSHVGRAATTSVHAPEVEGSGNDLQHEAEVSYQKALSLQNGQTGKELAAAVGLFRKSARLFESTRGYGRAADAHIQAGETYFTLSQYVNAR